MAKSATAGEVGEVADTEKNPLLSVAKPLVTNAPTAPTASAPNPMNDMGINPTLRQLYPDGNATVDGDGNTPVNTAIPNLGTGPAASPAPNPMDDVGINPALRRLYPDGNATVDGDGNTPASAPKVDTPAPMAPPAEAPAPAETQKTSWEKQKEEVAAKVKEEADQPDVASKKTEISYTPIKWKRSAAEEAKMQIQAAIEKNEPGFFTNLLTLGTAGNRFELSKALAEKQAIKAITEARNKVEAESFDQWVKQTQLQDQSQRTALDERRMIADEELKAAQAFKARQAASGVIRLTGDGRKDMQAATSALRVTKDVEDSFKRLVRKDGPGFVSGIPKEYLTAYVLGAGANTDSSTASVAGVNLGANAKGGLSVGPLNASGGVGASASTGASYGVGGAYIDPKVAKEAIEYFDKLDMSPEQRDFIMKTRQAAQQLGKIREGNRMTDADLRFYLDNLINMDSPQAFASSLTAAKDKVLESYKEMYNTYAPSNKDLQKAFASPETFMTGSLLDSTQLGYKDEEEMAAFLDRYRFNSALDLGQQSGRTRRIKGNLRQSPAQVRGAGYGTGTTISSVAAQGKEAAKETAGVKGKRSPPSFK
jgi:hypothetical protein